MFSIPLFLSNLNTHKIGLKIEYLKSTDSTNSTIFKLFENQKMKSGNVLIADEQTAGMGRRGNHWFSCFFGEFGRGPTKKPLVLLVFF